MLSFYQNCWSLKRDPIFLRSSLRSDKFTLKRLKLAKVLKAKSKKVFWDPDLYPTDFRKKNMSALRSLSNFFMRGGCLVKSETLLRTVYSTLYNLLVFCPPVFLKKKYKFFETLGQIILHDNTWFKFNNLLTYYINKVKPLFYIQSISIAKTFKKKKKVLRIKPYRLFLKKLPVQKRFHFAVRELSLYIRSVKRVEFTDRILVGFLNLFMLDKKAFLFKKKLKCYRKALNSYITYRAIR